MRRRAATLALATCIIIIIVIVEYINQASTKILQSDKWLLDDVLKTVWVKDNSSLLSPTSSTTPAEADGINNDDRQLMLIYRGKSNVTLTENTDTVTADDYFYRFLYHLHYTCEDYIRLGDSVDGGWDVCVVAPFHLKRPCLVYSFGINNDFSFDDGISIKFGCTVRAFDPSMEVDDHRRGPNIWFYKIGLAGSDRVEDNGWNMRTLDSIVKLVNDSGKIIDYLKIDIENSEWESLEAMFKSDILTRVKQLGIEVHMLPVGITDPVEFYNKWRTLKRLEEFGFRRWYWHFNHWGAYQYQDHARSCCYELVYINANFLRNQT